MLLYRYTSLDGCFKSLWGVQHEYEQARAEDEEGEEESEGVSLEEERDGEEDDPHDHPDAGDYEVPGRAHELVKSLVFAFIKQAHGDMWFI